MGQLWNVRRANGKFCTRTYTRELAEREVGWQIASGNIGPFTIDVSEVDGFVDSLGWCWRPHYTGPWPAAKLDEFRIRYGAGEPMLALERHFGCNAAILHGMVRKHGFERRIDDPSRVEQHGWRWTGREEQLVNLMYDEGIGTSKIPEHHPRTRKAVEARLRVTAKDLSTRSKFGRFIAAGHKTIHRVLEEAGEPPVLGEENSQIGHVKGASFCMARHKP